MFYLCREQTNKKTSNTHMIPTKNRVKTNQENNKFHCSHITDHTDLA